MRWERLFEGLEDEFAFEIEAERALHHAERERARIGRLQVVDRMRALRGSEAALELPSGTQLRGTVVAVGTDWVGLDAGAQGSLVVRIAAVLGVSLSAGVLRLSLHSDETPVATLAERLGLTLVLRNAARKRLPCELLRVDGARLTGTIDRSAGDHLDLAVHEHGASSRDLQQTSVVCVPHPALAAVRFIAAELPA